MQNDGEDDSAEAGRAIVREVFLDRLVQAGLQRPRAITAASHRKSLDHLVDFLSYMARDNLAVLAETVLLHAAAPKGSAGCWPAEVLIRQCALALQERPFELHPIVASWLRSREGPVAEACGYLVELFEWLRKNRRPLLVGDLNSIKRQAGEEQRRLARVRDRITKGVEWESDRADLAAYLRALEQARQYVQEGADRRAAQGAAA